MIETAKKPLVLEQCLVSGRLAEFQSISLGLDNCQKSLNDYLDTKRNTFPRFFFISDDELLSILGSTDPACVQEHIVKASMFHIFVILYTNKLIKCKLMQFYENVK